MNRFLSDVQLRRARTELLESVWGPNWVGDTHVVDVHLSNLRRKLDKAHSLRIIHTVRGVGFRISNEVLDAAEEQALTTATPTSNEVAVDTETTAEIVELDAAS